MDLYWQPSSQKPSPDGPVIFDRSEDSAPSLPSPEAEHADPPESPLEESGGRIAFVWLMLSVVAKRLARDSESDMALLTYPKNAFEETVEQLDLRDGIGEVCWEVLVDLEAKIDRLRHIAEKTAVLESACRTQGLPIAAEANPCLMRYFDLVEGIVKS